MQQSTQARSLTSTRGPGIDFLPPNASCFSELDCYRDETGRYVLGENPSNQKVAQSAIDFSNKVIEATQVWGQRLQDETEENSRCAIGARVAALRLAQMARFSEAPTDLKKQCARTLLDTREALTPLYVLMDSVDPTEEKAALKTIGHAQNEYQDLGEGCQERWPDMIRFHENQIEEFLKRRESFVGLQDPIASEVFSQRPSEPLGSINDRLSAESESGSKQEASLEKIFGNPSASDTVV